MKKAIAVLLCVGMLSGCSRMETDANKIEEGAQRSTDDIQDGFDQVEDRFEESYENRNYSDTPTGSLYETSNIDTVPSYCNAMMGKSSTRY